MRYRGCAGHVTFFASPKKVTKERRPRGSPIAGQVKSRNEQSVSQDSWSRLRRPRVSVRASPGYKPIPARLLPSPGGCKYVRQAGWIIANIKRVKHVCARRVVHCKHQAKQTCVRPHSYPPGEGRRRGWPGFGRAWLRLNHGHRGAAWRILADRLFVSAFDLPRDWCPCGTPRSPFFGYFLWRRKESDVLRPPPVSHNVPGTGLIKASVFDLDLEVQQPLNPRMQ